MIHNLTDKQLQALRWIIEQIKNGTLQESFITQSVAGFGTPLDKIQIVEIENLPDFITEGVLDALVDAKVLVAKPVPAGTRYTLTPKAYYVADFDFDNPELDPITLYIKRVIPLIKKRFDLPEFEELCFALDVVPDRDIEHKKIRELELCRYLRRVGRLQRLTPALQKLRPNFYDWPPYPDEDATVQTAAELPEIPKPEQQTKDTNPSAVIVRGANSLYSSRKKAAGPRKGKRRPNDR